jgi:hypothetical protein
MRRALDGAAELAAVVSQERPVPALAKAGRERVEDAASGRDFLQDSDRKRLPNRIP